jgi:GABA(A) receptor-associated protein
MQFRFKIDNSDGMVRKQNCDKIKQQFPDKIPIICEKDPKSEINNIDKTKYLVPNDLTVAQFSFMIRKRLQLPETEAFFLLAKGKYSITAEMSLIDVYKKYCDSEDGFLYIAYASKEIWGNN